MRDSESGFYLCTLRYYDPSGGRWISRDPIGYAGGSDLYGYVGNDPVNFSDPSGLWKLSEPSSWFDGNGYQGSGLEVNADALHRGGLGAEAAVDGIIPFVDPFAHFGGYNACEKDLQFSWKAGAFARDIYLGSKIPNLATWVKNPLMYEIGQKTMTAAPKSGLTAIEMGQQLVKSQGLLKAMIPEGAGWRLGIGVTFRTGPTPGGWIGGHAVGKAAIKLSEAAYRWCTEP